MFTAPNPQYAERTRDSFARQPARRMMGATLTRVEGRVVKPGRPLCVVHGEVYARSGDKRTLCAVMQQTLIVLHGQPDDTTRRN